MGAMRSMRRRLKQKKAESQPQKSKEKLVAVAIVRDGVVHSKGFKEHWRLRASLDPNNFAPTEHVQGDTDGFLTSEDRFLDREQAQWVAFKAGQIRDVLPRPLLSSDLNW